MISNRNTVTLLILTVIGVMGSGAEAAPACQHVTPTCDSLNGQMQQIFSPRADNNYGRIADFYRIDHNRWLRAKAPRYQALRGTEVIRVGKDQEAEYQRGQMYASLSENEKWMVLRARDPVKTLWSVARRDLINQVGREAEFFENLRTVLIKRAYMTMTPDQRTQVVEIKEANKVEEYIRVNAGSFLVIAYQVDRNDILANLLPATAQTLLFPKP